MRAREPDTSGYVDREGVRVYYEVFGSGPDSIVFAPADSIVDSRMWKGQVAYLARHHQVVVIDGRGNGGSDRPLGSEHYTDLAFVGDLTAVMDACGIDRAVLVGLCDSAWYALFAAARHPDRVSGVVAIAPSSNDGTPPPDRGIDTAATWVADFEDPQGWEVYNEAVWRRDWSAFPRYFFSQICNDPHSSKVYEDVVGWSGGTTGEVMISLRNAEYVSDTVTGTEEVLGAITCPVLVVHGTHDVCQPVARGVRMARLAGAELLVLGRAGHVPHARYPVAVNRVIADFVGRVTAGTAARSAGPPRVRVLPTTLEETTMKAREPDATGFVERDGVRVAWQSYGELRRPDDPAVLLLPTWCIVPAEIWKLQVAYLARRTRVITFDPRGNGASDRPESGSAYLRAEQTQDALDVLDATGTERAVVVGLSMGNLHALDLASDHPDRVAAWVAIAPAIRDLVAVLSGADQAVFDTLERGHR